MSRSPSQSLGITEAILAQVRELMAGDLPEEITELARQCVLDWLGVALAGVDDPMTAKLLEVAREQGGHPLSTVLGYGERTSPMFAAMINASAADVIDFADSNYYIAGHTTPAIVAAILALAEPRNSSGRDVLRALVVGIETACRIGSLTKHSLHPNGFHPTGTLVTFGAAAAAADLLGLDAEKTAQALGIAATQAAGLVASAGTMSKPFHSGKSAMNGLLAADLAQRGFIGRPDAVEAEGGFLEAHIKGLEPAVPSEFAGRFIIRNTKFKYHASCALTHGSIENLLRMKATQQVTADSVESIEMQIPRSSIGVCNIEDPQTGLEAKFSLRTLTAMVLLGDDTGDIGVYTDEYVTRPEVKRLGTRVRVTPRDDLGPGVSVTIAELTDGRRVTEECDSYQRVVDLARQRENLSRKFQALVAPLLGDRSALELQRMALDLDRLDSVRPLMALSITKPR